MMIYLCVFSVLGFAEETHVFLSFSMPEKLLIETLNDCAEHHIPATLNGLVDNSMAKTAALVMTLTAKVPQLQLQIDPTLFERFDIHQVPALVVAHSGCFDVIYGNLSLTEGLSRIREKGGCWSRGDS